jgi:predicted dehydrogenase
MDTLRLGVIGLSEGNGHPYSWSTIINGDYDADAMEQCGFPVIPAYLRANRDTLGVDGARVTHVWTQDRAISAHVAKASHIQTVCDRLEDMVGAVDAVLLARDDPEQHVAMAKPFIDAGVPIFIDKPLAFSRKDLDWFAAQHAAGRFVMSCSALRHSAGVQAARVDLATIGDVELAIAVGKKGLRTYAIHYLEGMFSLLGDPRAVSVRHVGRDGKDSVIIEFENGMVAFVHVFMDIAPAGELNVYGQKGALTVDHGGTYPAFRASLVEAIRSFRAGRPRLDFEVTRNLISTLVGARESLESGGRTIKLV